MFNILWVLLESVIFIQFEILCGAHISSTMDTPKLRVNIHCYKGQQERERNP